MVAATEWRRVRSLGRTTVSAKRYTTAEVAYQQARLRLLAYGLDERQITAIAGGKQQRCGDGHVDKPACERYE